MKVSSTLMKHLAIMGTQNSNISVNCASDFQTLTEKSLSHDSHEIYTSFYVLHIFHFWTLHKQFLLLLFFGHNSVISTWDSFVHDLFIFVLFFCVCCCQAHYLTYIYKLKYNSWEFFHVITCETHQVFHM